MALNVITIQGRLVRDPELRYTNTSTAVARFCVAVDRDYKSANGERATDFINCAAWRQTGEFVSKYFKKGSMITVYGRLQMNTYVDRDGNNRTAAEIAVSGVYFGGERQNNSIPSGTHIPDAGEPLNGESYTDPYAGFDDITDADGELPF